MTTILTAQPSLSRPGPIATVPRLRSSQPAADIVQFFDIVGQALTGYIQTEGAPEGVSPVYVEDFPKERLTQPDTPCDIITFRVLDGQPAPVRNDGTTIARAPQLRESVPSPNAEGYNLETYGYWENYTVLFEIWSKSNATANTLALWFHKFLIRYANVYQFFEAYGIKNFTFFKRLEDTSQEQANQELQLRRYSYTFRLESLDTFHKRQLTELTVNISLKPRGEVQTICYPPVTP